MRAASHKAFRFGDEPPFFGAIFSSQIDEFAMSPHTDALPDAGSIGDALYREASGKDQLLLDPLFRGGAGEMKDHSDQGVDPL